MLQRLNQYVITVICLCLAAAFLLPSCSFAAVGEYELADSFPVQVVEPSGLTYDPHTDTLWTVRDGRGGVYQLDKQGELLTIIDIRTNDLEGIAYNPLNDTFLLAEERHREILEIDRQGNVLRTIKVPIEWRMWNLNHGIEGVSIDPRTGHVFVANEKSPKAVIELDEDGNVIKSFEVEEADDLSDICYAYSSGNLLVLSHESKKIMEFTPGGKLVSSLTIDIPQAEGITKDADGNIYIICDKSETLYVFTPVKK
ncbi:MAG TPA: hypothetical protein DIS73_00175 [Planctomycetia bacterium]|nr:hypothetical protein [Planctomycetia bacterium]